MGYVKFSLTVDNSWFLSVLHDVKTTDNKVNVPKTNFTSCLFYKCEMCQYLNSREKKFKKCANLWSDVSVIPDSSESNPHFSDWMLAMVESERTLY